MLFFGFFGSKIKLLYCLSWNYLFIENSAVLVFSNFIFWLSNGFEIRDKKIWVLLSKLKCLPIQHKISWFFEENTKRKKSHKGQKEREITPNLNFDGNGLVLNWNCDVIKIPQKLRFLKCPLSREHCFYGLIKGQ